GTRARTVASEEQDLIAWSESYVDRDRPTDLAARKEPDVAEALGITPEVAGILDALCDDLLQIEQSPEGNPASLVDAMRDKIMMLGEYAQDEGRDSSAALCHTMAALCEVARDAVHGHDDRFIEAAYGFCEAFVEASTDPNSAIVFNWSKEVQQLAEAWQRAVARPQSRAAAVPPARGAARPAPMPEPPEPVANIRPDGGALRALLQNAQRAIGDGNVSGAKVLVLEAAANLGKIEAAKAEQIVEQTERSLQRSTEAIAAARKRVKEAEDAVLDAEERVAQGEAACDEGHALVEEIADARKEMQAAIARFEAQILELRRQRETKEQEMHEAGAQFEEARRQYAEMEAELAHGVDTEKAARVTLEDARQHVKNLQRKHAEVEAALTRARDQLTQQLVSLDDIVNTIAQIQGGGPQPAGKSEDLLF
ncbi:MAG: hypothetical protein QG656_1756, partial [Candidatus Hydrogenedentes bacterium]|nr:hypothetical protein [Candidatus Hydrogenedentota bacterium]